MLISCLPEIETAARRAAATQRTRKAVLSGRSEGKDGQWFGWR